MPENEPSVNRQEPQTIQVVMTEPLIEPFKQWLAARRLHLAGPIPVQVGGDPDLPTYIIGINQDLWDDVYQQGLRKEQ